MSKQISSKRRAMVYERDGRQCQYCGKPNLSIDEITLDHITPQVFGGAHSVDNLRVACKSCNSSRSKASIEDFRLQCTLRASGLLQTISTTQAKVLMERGIDLKLKPAHVFFFEQKEVEQ